MVALLGGLALVFLPSPAGAAARHKPKPGVPVPAGFVGVNLSTPLFPAKPGINVAHQFDVMAQSGVESVRVPFDWATAQPYATIDQVPAGERSQYTEDAAGTPTRWAPFDELVGQAAAHGMTVLPTVINAPLWDGTQNPNGGGGLAIPNSAYFYANFITDLVERYGPNGTFWAKGRPKLPIEDWQIWNEPNVVGYWWKQPFEQSYVTMLEAIYPVIKAADPHAKVVLAGFPNYSWGFLERIYRIHGARKYFDIVALHPYTKYPQGVITIADRVRVAMNTHGDPFKPMMITETGWPSSLGKTRTLYDFETTQSGQARNVTQLLRLLAANRRHLRLLGFYWYDWANVERPGDGPFAYSGFFRVSSGSFQAKPSFTAFRQAALRLEQCRAKGVRANICMR
jgi:polysaccharide biosynthesis protein PslG